MTSPSVSFRRATPLDAPSLSAFARRVFHDTFAADNTPEDMAVYLAQAFSPATQQAELEETQRVCLLMEADGVLIGYASLLDSAPHSAVAAAHPVEIERFYLDQGWHGRGVAAALMDAARGVARGWQGDVLWLGVWERNAKAIHFYEKQGFERVGAQTFCLGSDEQQDAVMSTALTA
ncbi:GNAT family N-acetyltransferase [Gemmatimonas sp.]|uniref:GNAT family N-acetyltransferase n=1 Tax=Gemmatimonas sp. TaxID=1962908 RepID=UPI003F71BE43